MIRGVLARVGWDGAFVEFLQRVAVMRLHIVTIELHQHVPAKAVRRRHPVERRPALLICHLEEKQIRQLRDENYVTTTV
jgi:hypothetical protein